MGKISETSEEVTPTPTQIRVDELAARHREHREDLVRHDGELSALTGEVRRIGGQVMGLWWGLALLGLVDVVGFLTVLGR